MGQPFIGEIRLFAGNFAPVGWAFCNGQTLAIAENDALFTLIGTTYGGDGQNSFRLPDLQGRVPVHKGTGAGVTYQLGEQGGVESVTLTTNQIPAHTHSLIVSQDQGSQSDPTNAMVGSNPTVQLFRPGAAVQTFDASAMSPVGGSQPHDNMQPYIAIHYIIALFGLFPPP
ncbi:MAG: phage tail protein [Allosphingosinicella sp.]